MGRYCSHSQHIFVAMQKCSACSTQYHVYLWVVQCLHYFMLVFYGSRMHIFVNAVIKMKMDHIKLFLKEM